MSVLSLLIDEIEDLQKYKVCMNKLIHTLDWVADNTDIHPDNIRRQLMSDRVYLIENGIILND